MITIITGDILRPEISGKLAHQRHNIAWLWSKTQHLFPNRLLIGPDDPFIYKADDWIKTDQSTSFKCKHLEIIDKYKLDYQNIFILGFELPNNAIEQFQKNCIDYLDFSIHPVRFLKQRVLGIKTNLNIEREFIVDDADFYAGAMYYKPIEITKEINLLVGQTRIDRSLLNNGRMLSLKDFKDEIQEIAPFIYRPHPLDESYQVDDMIALGGTVSNNRTYDLLSSPKIKSAYGISSSVLYEAKYFNKPSTFFRERKEHSNFIPIYEQDFFSTSFFHKLLASCHIFSVG